MRTVLQRVSRLRWRAAVLSAAGLVLAVGGEVRAEAIASQVTAAGSHSCARKADGTAWCWGANNGGLGDGSLIERYTPLRLTALGNTVASIAAGAGQTCARKADGTAWCWGDNTFGQIGDGTDTSRHTPVPVATLGTSVAQIGAGLIHTCARKTDGTVWCWGDNSLGQIGDGGSGGAFSPVPVAGLTGVGAISLGTYHSCARKLDGTVWCWGYNFTGQLGDGTTIQRNAPVQVVGLAGAVEVAAGHTHSCARKSDGTVWCWGNNQDGELGDGTTVQRLTPVPVTALGTNAAELSAGGSFGGVSDPPFGGAFTCARKIDGTLWCWGRNTRGQLGDGTTVSRTTPGQVTALGNAVAEVSAGATQACALKTDGTFWCWGHSPNGGLGDGTALQRLQPVLVTFTPAASVVVDAPCETEGCVYDPVLDRYRYSFSDANDALRVLYFGVLNHSPAGLRRCNSPVRRALIEQYTTIYGLSPALPLRHAWRRGDAASSVFLAAVGAPPQFALAAAYSGGVQQSNPFCNAGDVDLGSQVQGIHLGFDDSEVPLEGPNWNTKIGESDQADLDPIRSACQAEDQVCRGDGTQGFVQVIAPEPGVLFRVNYPADHCDGGSVDLAPSSAPYEGYFGRCGDGSPALVGQCVIGYKTCTSSTPCNVPGAQFPKTSGITYHCYQQSVPGSAGYCWLGAPQNGEECRGANAWIRNVDGSLKAIGGRFNLGAAFRFRGTLGACTSTLDVGVIGCLEENIQPSIGPP